MTLADHESPVRAVVGRAGLGGFVSYASMAEAAQDADAALILEGDWGGQIYLACPLQVAQASEEVLHRLLKDLDRLAWECNEGEGAGLRLERLPAGAVVGGGMGGGRVDKHIWVHDEFVTLGVSDAIRQVIRGERDAVVLPSG